MKINLCIFFTLALQAENVIALHVSTNNANF